MEQYSCSCAKRILKIEQKKEKKMNEMDLEVAKQKTT